MTDTILIREAEGKDAEAIIEYCKIVGGQTDNLAMDSEGLPFTVEQEEAMLEKSLSSNRSIFLTAYKDNVLVATANISAKNNKRMAHKATLGIRVHKEYWGEGIASSIMKELINFAKNSSIEIIDLKVRSDNKRAINLYKKFGFEKMGLIPADIKIDGRYYDCDYMVLDLRQ